MDNDSRSSWFARGVLILAVFLVLTVAFRFALIAPAEQRSAASFDTRFGVVWEAWRALEQASGAVLEPGDALVDETIRLMASSVGANSLLIDPDGVLGQVEAHTSQIPRSVPDGLEDVWRAWRILRRDYPEASLDDLADAAMRGLMSSGADPALLFLDANEYQEAQDFFESDSYEGIGATVVQVDGSPVISEPFLGGPADRAGLLPGDRIVTVDGVIVAGMALDDVVDIVKGVRGTTVVLEIERPTDDPGQTRTVSVERDTVPESIRTRLFNADDSQPVVGYIWIQRFHYRTGDDFRVALEVLLDKGMEGLILDLRTNPGGSITGAVDVISEFTTDGLAMYEISNEGERTDWAVERGGIANELPVAVVVNGYSASSAEVVAGALQDHGRATVYGSQTYGKGSVQTFHELSDGSAIYLTVSRWYTPDGNQIQDVGIKPDVEVTLTLEDYLLRQDRALITAYGDMVDRLAGSADDADQERTAVTTGRG